MTALQLYSAPCEVFSGPNVRLPVITVSLTLRVTLSVTPLRPTLPPLHVMSTIALSERCSTTVSVHTKAKSWPATPIEALLLERVTCGSGRSKGSKVGFLLKLQKLSKQIEPAIELHNSLHQATE